MPYKNSVCYLCPDDTGLSCRRTCKGRAAEQQRNADERRQRLIQLRAEYDSARQTNGIVHERKVCR